MSTDHPKALHTGTVLGFEQGSEPQLVKETGIEHIAAAAIKN